MKDVKNQDLKENIFEIDGKKHYIDRKTGEVFEIFSDKSSTGKERPWRELKIKNEEVEKCYRRIAEKSVTEYWTNKADRLHACGLKIRGSVYKGGVKRVKHAESCRVRLCPLCTWRRSIKIQTHMRKILEAMQAEREYEYLLVTFTIPNVTGEELPETLDSMMKSWNRLSGYKDFKKAVKGWYRGLEISHNVEKYKVKYIKTKEGKKKKIHIVDENGNYIDNPFFDTYHPHFHCIFAVNKSYFKKNDYIKRDEWLKMWQKAMKDESITQVDVRKVKPKGNNEGGTFGDMIITAICETAKYAVKSADYVLPWDWELSCKSIEVLDNAIANRRLVAFGGLMKEWHRKLNLDDEIDGNLVEEGETPNEEEIRTFCATWLTGFQQYKVTWTWEN